MAEFGQASDPDTLLPKISQETLAEMIGTTRSRLSFFMNRFRASVLSITTAAFVFTNPC